MSSISNTYDPGRVYLYWLKGAGVLGASCILGQARLNQADDTRGKVPISSVTISDGYELGDVGEMSLDPATASATFAEYVTDGTPHRYNMLDDNRASVETDLAGWTVPYPATTTMTRSTLWAPHGTYSMLVTATSVVPGQSGTVAFSSRQTLTGYSSSTGDYTFTCMAMVADASTTPVLGVRAAMTFHNSSGTQVGPLVEQTTQVGQEAEVRVQVTGNRPSNTTTANVTINFVGAFDVGAALHLDAFMFEPERYPSDYFHLGYEPATGLEISDRIEVQYDYGWGDVPRIIFQGVVAEMTMVIESSNEAIGRGKAFERRTTYALRSNASVLLDTMATFTDLPSEPAIARARRFLDITTTLLMQYELDQMNAVMVPASPGTVTKNLLDIVREFTLATKFALRIRAGLPVTPKNMEVVPVHPEYNNENWDRWTKSITWGATPESPQMTPTAATVVSNDLRFLTGTQTLNYGAGRKIGTEFQIGSSWIGEEWYSVMGIRPGQRVMLAGYSLAVSRITLALGQKFTTSIELGSPYTQG